MLHISIVNIMHILKTCEVIEAIVCEVKKYVLQTVVRMNISYSDIA